MKSMKTPSDDDRFPGYDVLSQSEKWDPVTTGVVLRRLGPLPGVRFFSAEREPTARALMDRLLAQETEQRIPVLELVDTKLVEGQTKGWRYEDIPEDGQAWLLSVDHLDADAQTFHGSRFHELEDQLQDALLESIRTGDDWHGLPAKHVWSLWMRYVCEAFYSHPWAWNEIGFGGPAYPRGYANFGLDGVEHWEERDRKSP